MKEIDDRVAGFGGGVAGGQGIEKIRSEPSEALGMSKVRAARDLRTLDQGRDDCDFTPVDSSLLTVRLSAYATARVPLSARDFTVTTAEARRRGGSWLVLDWVTTARSSFHCRAIEIQDKAVRRRDVADKSALSVGGTERAARCFSLRRRPDSRRSGGTMFGYVMTLSIRKSRVVARMRCLVTAIHHIARSRKRPREVQVRAFDEARSHNSRSYR